MKRSTTTYQPRFENTYSFNEEGSEHLNSILCIICVCRNSFADQDQESIEKDLGCLYPCIYNEYNIVKTRCVGESVVFVVFQKGLARVTRMINVNERFNDNNINDRFNAFRYGLWVHFGSLSILVDLHNFIA